MARVTLTDRLNKAQHEIDELRSEANRYKNILIDIKTYLDIEDADHIPFEIGRLLGSNEGKKDLKEEISRLTDLLSDATADAGVIKEKNTIPEHIDGMPMNEFYPRNKTRSRRF